MRNFKTLELTWKKTENSDLRFEAFQKALQMSKEGVTRLGFTPNLVYELDIESVKLILKKYDEYGEVWLKDAAKLIDSIQCGTYQPKRFKKVYYNLEKIGAATSGHASIYTALIFLDSHIFSTSGGHGFAAERANTFVDLSKGYSARVVGGDNLKNGPDRLVDHTFIQSKYCSTGEKCIQACLDNYGNFRYYTEDLFGKKIPMQIEVPSDKYDAAVEKMKTLISKCKIEGVLDPSEASNIVRRGHFTYAQAKNIAKAGTIESISYDATTGAVNTTYTFGLTAIVSFAVAIWSGENIEKASKVALVNALKVSGVVFLTHIIASQIGRTSLRTAFQKGTLEFTKFLGPKTFAAIVNVYREAGKHGVRSIYGAAATQSLSKLLAANIITSAITLAVFTAFDLVEVMSGKMSAEQMLKNSVVTGSSIAASVGGTLVANSAIGNILTNAAVGASLGSAVPIVGNIIGLTIGIGVGILASIGMKNLMDELIEDDIIKLGKIANGAFTKLCLEYMVSKEEFEMIEKKVSHIIDEKFFKKMFSMGNDSTIMYYAAYKMDPIFKEVVKKRKKIQVSEELIVEKLNSLFEECSDSNILSDIEFEQNNEDDWKTWREGIREVQQKIEENKHVVYKSKIEFGEKERKDKNYFKFEFSVKNIPDEDDSKKDYDVLDESLDELPMCELMDLIYKK